MKLGITTIQRDRAPWVKEWIVFHYLVGFRKFYFYAHNCSDKTVDILYGMKKKFDINLFPIHTTSPNPQLKCYQESYIKFGQEVDWMAYIDADEFLFPTSADSMETVLEEFTNKKISALGVYWSCFGSSGYKDEPKGLLIENYKKRAKDGYHNNRHIKSILRGGKNQSVQVADPHFFRTLLGTYDENLRPINKGWTDYEPTYKKLRINHYVTQSRNFFLNFKNKVSGPDGTPPKEKSYWDEHNKNDVIDNSMDRFIQPVKDILGGKQLLKVI